MTVATIRKQLLVKINSKIRHRKYRKSLLHAVTLARPSHDAVPTFVEPPVIDEKAALFTLDGTPLFGTEGTHATEHNNNIMNNSSDLS